MNSPTITIRLPKPEREALTAGCEARGVTITEYVRRAVAASLAADGPIEVMPAMTEAGTAVARDYTLEQQQEMQERRALALQYLLGRDVTPAPQAEYHPIPQPPTTLLDPFN
jgi:hypothetical protein